jgi:hypothetical protein
VPVVAVKTPVNAPALTVTAVGVTSALLVFAIVTTVPPVGAGVESVAVQVVEAFEPRLEGLQESEETSMVVDDATRFSEVVLGTLL